MKSFKILIVEDEPLFATEVEMLVFKLGYEKLHLTNNSEEALHMVKVMEPDLIIMDINIDGDLNGIEVAERIEKYNIPIIFITSQRDISLYQKAKNTNSIAYLIKPFDLLSLQSTIEFAVAQLDHKKVDQDNYRGWDGDLVVQNNLLIKKNTSLHKLPIDQISYIQSDGNYCAIYVNKKEKYIVTISLSKMLNKLPSKQFMRVHKSYIIQLSLVKDITPGVTEVTIGPFQIPVGRSFRKALLDRFEILG